MTHDVFISWRKVLIDNGIPKNEDEYLDLWNDRFNKVDPETLCKMICSDYPRWSILDSVRLISCDVDGDWFEAEYRILQLRFPDKKEEEPNKN